VGRPTSASSPIVSLAMASASITIVVSLISSITTAVVVLAVSSAIVPSFVALLLVVVGLPVFLVACIILVATAFARCSESTRHGQRIALVGRCGLQQAERKTKHENM
jgi:hypothetical protein